MTEAQIFHDLVTPKFGWDHPGSPRSTFTSHPDVSVVKDAYDACDSAHAVCIITEWDEFKVRVKAAWHALQLCTNREWDHIH